MNERAVGLEAASEAQRAFLLGARVGRLATVDQDGRPHVVPVCFSVLDFRIYSPLDEKPKRVGPMRLRRVGNILRHPDICLVVDRYSEAWEELAWLQVRGNADLLAPGEGEHGRAVVSLRGRYPQYVEMALELRPMLRITPVRIVSWGI